MQLQVETECIADHNNRRDNFRIELTLPLRFNILYYYYMHVTFVTYRYFILQTSALS